jgi:predicted DNA-binding protein
MADVKTVTIRLTPAEYKKLKLYSVEIEKDMTSIIKEALKKIIN